MFSVTSKFLHLKTSGIEENVLYNKWNRKRIINIDAYLCAYVLNIVGRRIEKNMVCNFLLTHNYRMICIYIRTYHKCIYHIRNDLYCHCLPKKKRCSQHYIFMLSCHI